MASRTTSRCTGGDALAMAGHHLRREGSHRQHALARRRSPSTSLLKQANHSSWNASGNPPHHQTRAASAPFDPKLRLHQVHIQ